MFFEILCNTDLFSFEVKGHSGGVVGEVHIVHSVGSAVAPVGNDNLLSVLCFHSCLVLLVVSVLLLELYNSIKARTSAHKFEDGIHADHTSKFALDCSSFESSPDLEAC